MIVILRHPSMQYPSTLILFFGRKNQLPTEFIKKVFIILSKKMQTMHCIFAIFNQNLLFRVFLSIVSTSLTTRICILSKSTYVSLCQNQMCQKILLPTQPSILRLPSQCLMFRYFTRLFADTNHITICCLSSLFLHIPTKLNYSDGEGKGGAQLVSNESL